MSDSHPLPVEIARLSDGQWAIYVKRSKQMVVEMLKLLADIADGTVRTPEDLE